MIRHSHTTSSATRRKTGYRRVKRCLDVLMAMGILFATAPLWLAAAIVVRIGSPGPVFFTQQRVGEAGKPFRIWKFRTMHVYQDGRDAPSVTVANDPRVFAAGVWLRRTKIDELPQLFNVLIGDMSLVGPRPTVAADYERMNARQKCRTEVPPGLTGLAQISGNTSLSWPQRIELDLQYVAGMSWRLDAYVLAKTFGLVAMGRAASDPPGTDEWQEAA
ncbi:MAG: sugar transferase [Planctomycetales bacterium]|nr:sugar transferase [Planctomycetales bacterium]